MIIIGHRGARRLSPENSLASFDRAIACGVAYVEFDVRLTRDRQLVVIHDRHTKRVAFIKKHIGDLTLAEVTSLATRDGIPIPTFKEVLAHLKGRVKINIEIKSRHSAAKVWEDLRPYWNKGFNADDVLVSSSRLGELKAMRVTMPEIRLALLQRRFPLRFLFVPHGLELFALGTKHILLTPWIITKAKQHRLLTYAYTVNNPKRAKELSDWGLDAICTDRPDVITSAL